MFEISRSGAASVRSFRMHAWIFTAVVEYLDSDGSRYAVQAANCQAVLLMWYVRLEWDFVNIEPESPLPHRVRMVVRRQLASQKSERQHSTTALHSPRN